MKNATSTVFFFFLMFLLIPSTFLDFSVNELCQSSVVKSPVCANKAVASLSGNVFPTVLLLPRLAQLSAQSQSQ